MISPLRYFLGLFGYAKIPVEAIRLAMKLRMDLSVLGEDHPMYRAAKALEDLLRSCRRLG